jgi:hypothetical protein
MNLFGHIIGERTNNKSLARKIKTRKQQTTFVLVAFPGIFVATCTTVIQHAAHISVAPCVTAVQHAVHISVAPCLTAVQHPVILIELDPPRFVWVRPEECGELTGTDVESIFKGISLISLSTGEGGGLSRTIGVDSTSKGETVDFEVDASPRTLAGNESACKGDTEELGVYSPLIGAVPDTLLAAPLASIFCLQNLILSPDILTKT